MAPQECSNHEPVESLVQVEECVQEIRLGLVPVVSLVSVFIREDSHARSLPLQKEILLELPSGCHLLYLGGAPPLWSPRGRHLF